MVEHLGFERCCDLTHLLTVSLPQAAELRTTPRSTCGRTCRSFLCTSRSHMPSVFLTFRFPARYSLCPLELPRREMSLCCWWRLLLWAGPMLSLAGLTSEILISKSFKGWSVGSWHILWPFNFIHNRRIPLPLRTLEDMWLRFIAFVQRGHK